MESEPVQSTNDQTIQHKSRGIGLFTRISGAREPGSMTSAYPADTGRIPKSPLKASVQSRLPKSPLKPNAPTWRTWTAPKLTRTRRSCGIELLAWLFMGALWVCWACVFMPAYHEAPVAPDATSQRRLVERHTISESATHSFPRVSRETKPTAVPELLGGSADPPDRSVNRVIVVTGEGDDQETNILSNEPRQPLVRVAPDFLPIAQFESIKVGSVL